MYTSPKPVAFKIYDLLYIRALSVWFICEEDFCNYASNLCLTRVKFKSSLFLNESMYVIQDGKSTALSIAEERDHIDVVSELKMYRTEPVTTDVIILSYN